MTSEEKIDLSALDLPEDGARFQLLLCEITEQITCLRGLDEPFDALSALDPFCETEREERIRAIVQEASRRRPTPLLATALRNLRKPAVLWGGIAAAAVWCWALLDGSTDSRETRATAAEPGFELARWASVGATPNTEEILATLEKSYASE